MDINGAKALKRRLGPEGADEAVPLLEPADIPVDVPPVYRWTGKTPSATALAEREDSSSPRRRASLFSLRSLQ